MANHSFVEGRILQYGNVESLQMGQRSVPKQTILVDDGESADGLHIELMGKQVETAGKIGVGNGIKLIGKATSRTYQGKVYPGVKWQSVVFGKRSGPPQQQGNFQQAPAPQPVQTQQQLPQDQVDIPF